MGLEVPDIFEKILFIIIHYGTIKCDCEVIKMGDFYKYKCKHCEYEQEYYTGGGFFTEDYYRETELSQKKLKDDILLGKYGNLLKQLVENDVNDELSISCNTKLFQCDSCRALSVCHAKLITNYQSEQYLESYKIKIQIYDTCPLCDNGKLKDISYSEIIPCPKCAKTMELVEFGKWD